MGSREAVSGAVFGAFVMAVVSVAFAWFASGPDHQDWSRSAIALTPFAALFGAAAGAVGGLLLRVTRPPARRSPYTTRRDRDRREKRRNR
jgi:ribose/xylose/arabinose/galactoside ABC-type transport system permease subunit